MDARARKIQKVTVWGAVTNLMLSLLKLLAGIMGSSAAMVADAVHSFSDLASDFVVIAFNRISSREKDKGHDYGHGKFETLATFSISLILAYVAVHMMVSSISSIKEIMNGAQVQKPGIIALVAALVSIGVKEALFQWTAHVGRAVESQVMVANAWHHRSDALSSVGSLFGIGGAILLGGKWIVLDPLIGAIISIIIFIVAVKLALPSLSQLTDASLPEQVESKMVEILSSVPGVMDVHELKTRQSGQNFIAEAHIVVLPDMTVKQAHDITVTAEKKLRDEFGNGMQITIHVEPSVDAL